MPGYLTLVGEILMGTSASVKIALGTCALIHTGGMLPGGADSVVMLEDTQTVQSRKMQNYKVNEIEITHAVAAGENILQVGEDVMTGNVVIKCGSMIRPAEVGGCMALGIVQLRVAIKPKVGIISTGDEIIDPEEQTSAGQVRDINSFTLAALIESAGGEPVLYGILKDDLDLLTSVARKAINECDAVVITAGSSASSRDTTVDAIRRLGKPEVLVHGINIRPGKPTILSVCKGKAVIGLPGNPVSALVVASVILVPLIKSYLGLTSIRVQSTVLAKLMINIASQAGREDWIAVKLIPNSKKLPSDIQKKSEEEFSYFAEPIFGKSNLIFSLVAADGLIRIPMERTGISAGEIVEVIPM
jgi:molybdopterin molybdotransferase